MTVTLTPDQIKWLEAQVAGGRFDSIEDAVRLAVAGLMTLDADDLAWAKPLVDEARASIGQGGGIPAEDVKAQLVFAIDRRAMTRVVVHRKPATTSCKLLLLYRQRLVPTQPTDGIARSGRP